MEKQKIDLNKLLMAESINVTFTMGDGTVINVTPFIPYEEKEDFAMEWAGMAIQTDEDLGVCYEGYSEQAVKAYLFAKYYTDINAEEYPPAMVFDYLTKEGKLDIIMDAARGDMEIVKQMKDAMVKAVKIRFEKEHSLGQMVKKLLDTDPDTNNAETRELIEKLIDMRGALMEKQESEKILEFGKKKAAKPVKTGGAVINISKKN